MTAPAREIPGVYWSAVCPACGKTIGIRPTQPERDVPIPCPCGYRAGYRWHLAEPEEPAPARTREGFLLPLELDRPLVVLDLETTGIDVREARIVEFAFCKVRANGTHAALVNRVNPTIPIPAEATAIHGIADSDVADLVPFGAYAEEILEFLEGCDLAGFNIRSYDLKVLMAELARAGHTLDLTGLRLIDALSIYHRREPRNLTAAVKLYCGRDHTEAHGALGDVMATLDVLAAQLERYPDLPRTVAELHTLFAPEGSMDLEGRFRKSLDGEPVFTFGKYDFVTLSWVARNKPDYLRWMLTQDFFPDTKALIRAALVTASGG